MKLGIALPNAVPGAPGDAVTTWARRAEECGFDSVAVIDRVVYDSVDPLVALAMAAAVTSRVELVTNVLIAPQHRTALLAKQAASIDRASGGRLTLGVGVGVRADDFAACEIPFRSRGARLDRQLDELRGIWNGEWGIGPAPARPGGPRLLIGGDAALAGPRAARHGGGWTMMVGTPDQFAAGVDTVHRAWREAGRPGTPRTMAVFYAALGEAVPNSPPARSATTTPGSAPTSPAGSPAPPPPTRTPSPAASRSSPPPAPTRSSSPPARPRSPSSSGSPASRCALPPPSDHHPLSS
ncbi:MULTISPECIES: LLM class flavin-dependent oxidoreductase [unclassified Parafrankia]|uniref:LLM class flavin-dependent oxidoreductase n=1 Tax=unclassified Parafrankia TaxID=2994368 RepID=UPI000DA4CBAD|nr:MULTISPECIES: LLM class flavin-dependent oxidoreductase [unclassified Parafrankia]TCJ35506.1 LLM class flavin-dependent oxidoreductase [Parafrankia sp. BMG5.11]SQD99581.1 conserved hypothetical protein [Parafrankia sp. Ea1.12]